MMKNLIILVAAAVVLTACGGTDNGPDDGFDRTTMLTSLADGLIIPSYNELDSDVAALESAVTSLTAAPSPANLNAAQVAFVASAMSFQWVVSYDFGPADNVFGDLDDVVGTFPANSSVIDSRILTGDTTTADFQHDVRGFAALDYLLFGGDNTALVDVLQGAEGANRRAYLNSIVRHLRTNVQRVSTAWSTYRSEFINRNGTDVGSSSSVLFNSMNMSHELAKNFKVGLPGGFRAGQVSPEPRRVEAYYSGISTDLLREHVKAIRSIWEGRNKDGQSLTGFRAWLTKVPGGDRLIVDTETQLDVVQTSLENLGSSKLADLCDQRDSRVNTLHTELQKLTRFYKSELSSLLGLSITYSSGDGD
ncbi:MAG TPA: imelysin family protein [Chlorobiota bacterium]|nr:imelysin family protein [Chlorobiota bacterium]